jgi:hypothetical protein
LDWQKNSKTKQEEAFFFTFLSANEFYEPKKEKNSLYGVKKSSIQIGPDPCVIIKSYSRKPRFFRGLEICFCKLYFDCNIGFLPIRIKLLAIENPKIQKSTWFSCILKMLCMRIKEKVANNVYCKLVYKCNR